MKRDNAIEKLKELISEVEDEATDLFYRDDLYANFHGYLEAQVFQSFRESFCDGLEVYFYRN